MTGGSARSRRLLRHVALDGLRNSVRRVNRTVLTGLGTLLGVAAVVATAGFVQTAKAQVDSTFDALRATQVTFSDTSPSSAHAPFIGDFESKLLEVRNIQAAGYLGDVNNRNPIQVRRTL